MFLREFLPINTWELHCQTHWDGHIHDISTEAKRVLGFIYRQYSAHLSQSSLQKLYLSLVRPHLEYASQVWNPHLQRDILKLEGVQKFALKICLKQWHLLTSYISLCVPYVTCKLGGIF